VHEGPCIWLRGVIDNVRRLGVVLRERPREPARRHPRAGDVRGKDLLASLELVRE
jgi:4-aminobutyrate aminotransferase-like enzyme